MKKVVGHHSWWFYDKNAMLSVEVMIQDDILVDEVMLLNISPSELVTEVENEPVMPLMKN